MASRALVSADAGPDPDDKIRLLIVDDSAVARAVLARMISQYPAFEIVDAVVGAREALDRLQHIRVDVILLDIEMPGITGITALPELIARAQGARILIVSALAEEGAAATVEALTLGAADTLPKPGKGSFGGRFAAVLCDRLLRLGRADGLALEAPVPAPRPLDAGNPPAVSARAATAISCVAVGASTGGLHALAELLRALPASFAAPILITQHLPAVFMPFFAQQMAQCSGRPAVVARDGMPIKAGRLHIAPGDAHLCVERHGGRVTVRLDQRKAASGCLPSVDPMFESAVETYGAGLAGVVLSGMGRDGASGAERLVAAGAELLAQNIETSVVWGMPGTVAKAGLATAILSPAEIARHLSRRGAE